MSSNYPDNIRDYDNCPGSPFYEAPWPKCPQCGEQYDEENDGGFETDFLDSVDDEVFCCSEECREKYNTENKEDTDEE